MIEDDEIGVSNEETVAHARAKMPDEQTMSDLGDFLKTSEILRGLRLFPLLFPGSSV